MSADTKGRLVGLVMAALLSPIWILVAHFSNETRGFVVFCVAGVFATIVYVKRNTVLQTRFLVPAAILLGVELSAALLMPLPSKIPGAVMIPISIGNLALLVWILSLFDRDAGGREQRQA